jgi:hypothetical protein
MLQKALKKLDKNRDGKLTMEELRPPPPGELPSRWSQGQRALERRGRMTGADWTSDAARKIVAVPMTDGRVV